MASVALFNLEITPPFLAGSALVLGSTWMYNSSEDHKASHEKESNGTVRPNSREGVPLLDRTSMEPRKSAEFEAYPLDAASESEDGCNLSIIAPIESHEPLLGYPHGIGSSRASSSQSKNSSMGGRLLEKVSGMVGTSGVTSGEREEYDEKGRGT